MPLFLEDTTGFITNSDYFDIYDRHPFLHLAQIVRPDRIISQIFELGSRPHPSRRHLMCLPEASVILEFGLNNALGTITFVRPYNKSFPMDRYLRKDTRHGRYEASSLIRAFVASDGIEYTWGYHTVANQEWSCKSSYSQAIVAHYDLKPSSEPAYRTSGNVLTVYEEFQHLSVEFLASLTVMRHIAAHNL
ncbi:hypothetical protein K439DRAFT_1391657 [Ramaria rubella]|nr:hypothetical protein K439DRAFT_1391657 [Ramaria rubella]